LTARLAQLLTWLAGVVHTRRRDEWWADLLYEQKIEGQDALFQAAFCLVLYNVAQLIKTHIACAAQKELQQISTQKLFDDACEQLSSFMLLAHSARSIITALDHRLRRSASIQMLRKRLTRRLAHVWTNWWTKSPTRPRPPTTTPKRYARSGRASVHRLLEEYRIKHKLHRPRT